jgi:hypothetical protein
VLAVIRIYPTFALELEIGDRWHWHRAHDTDQRPGPVR